MKDMIFQSADILLPKEEYLHTWPVIACDQFTSEKDYWDTVNAMYKNKVSSLHTILPEAYLKNDNSKDIKKIHDTMNEYLQQNIFTEYKDCYVYVERTLANQTIRKGLIGKLDLREYDFIPSHKTPVRASEKTVEERIPPRLKTKLGSSLDVSHIIVFCDDDEYRIIEPLSKEKDKMQCLYDMDLCMEGGHIRGWLVDGELKEQTDRNLSLYVEHQKEKYNQLLAYAVGDGNHSLAAMKETYRLLNGDPYALVELENIHDPVQVFEPIHRCLTDIDTDDFILKLKECFPKEEGISISWYTKTGQGTVYLPVFRNTEVLETLQPFLDRYIKEHKGKIDYIHGKESLLQLCQKDHAIGLLLPAFSSHDLFSYIDQYGVFPRKAFSIGEAKEKRYYMECRKI